MSSLESVIIKEPIKTQFLTIIMDENDSVYECIKQSMIEHDLKKCTVIECNGKIKEATINCFERSNYKKIDFKSKEILRVSGEFKLTNKELWGTIRVFTAGKNPLHGTLSKGIAENDFTLKMSFVR